MSFKNKQKLEKVAGWYRTSDGLNSFMIFCIFLEFKKFIKDPVLEIGAADGYMTDLILNNCKIDRLDIVEASSSYCKTLQEKFPNIIIINAFIEDLKNISNYKTVIISHVLEHVQDPIEVLKSIYAKLDKDGLLLISVPNAHSFHRLLGVEMGLLDNTCQLNDQDKKIGHFRVYDAKLLKQHLNISGFKVKMLTTSFIKFLSNRQTESIIPRKDWIHFYKLSKQFPRYGADIVAICRK